MRDSSTRGEGSACWELSEMKTPNFEGKFIFIVSYKVASRWVLLLPWFVTSSCLHGDQRADSSLCYENAPFMVHSTPMSDLMVGVLPL